MLELSHTVGNTALLEILSLRDYAPETAPVLRPFTAETASAEWLGGDAPALTEAPAFAQLAPMATAAPLNV